MLYGLHVHIDGGGDNQCASQEELEAVKADMQRQIDELHTQLHYWQNITITILRDQHHVNTGGKRNSWKYMYVTPQLLLL